MAFKLVKLRYILPIGHHTAIELADHVTSGLFAHPREKSVKQTCNSALDHRYTKARGVLGSSISQVNRNANGGIAAALALGGTFLPPDSSFAINFNLATYRGEQGFAGSLVGKVSKNVYITGGISGSTVKDSTGGRIGVAFGW